MGSPPPTRGTLKINTLIDEFTRITPAYAGNTLFLSLKNFLIEDHPRLRGEHNHVVNDTKECAGSPPPTRGTRNGDIETGQVYRITPAYAGNTNGGMVCIKRYRDHPRLRGEHFFINLKPNLSLGSPPPTRGTPTCQAPVRGLYGITPAYAGNTQLG